jgi:hypothetical protein
MKLIVEIPDEQVLRGVPRHGAVDYLAEANGDAREAARAAVARVIRFHTAFVPTVTIQDATRAADGNAKPSFAVWLEEMWDEAWRHHQISRAEAHALAMDQPVTWRSYYELGYSPKRALAHYFDSKVTQPSAPNLEVQR